MELKFTVLLSYCWSTDKLLGCTVCDTEKLLFHKLTVNLKWFHVLKSTVSDLVIILWSKTTAMPESLL